MNIRTRLEKIEKALAVNMPAIAYMSLTRSEYAAIETGTLVGPAEAQILQRHNLKNWPRQCKTYVDISPDDWD